MSYQVRTATVHDVNAIFHLTNDHAQVGLMLPRSKYKIITMLNNFSVVENAEKTVVACAALTPLWTDMAEIMALAVADEFQGQGIGRGMMERVMAYLEQSVSDGEMLMANLMAAQGKEEFYKKFGLRIRPNETDGAGMVRWFGRD